MPEWFPTPLIVTAVIAAVVFLVRVGIWVGKIGTELSQLRKDGEVGRATLTDFMKEIRADLKKILQRSPSSPNHRQRESCSID